MLALLLASGIAAAADTNGFAELRAQYALGVDGKAWTLVERLRPELTVPLSDRVQLSTSVEADLAEGRNTQEEVERTLDESDFGPLLEGAGCEWPTDTNDVLHVNGVDDYLAVDRLYLDWYHPKFDLRVGRQALQWGSALLINPTDPFPQILFTEPWKPRAGVNAARLTIPFGETRQLQVVAAANDTLDSGRAAFRGTVDVAGTDVSLVGAWRGDSQTGILGLDVKGTAVVGFWLEGAAHVDPDPADGDPHVYEEIAVGADYSFPVLDTLVVGVEYYRNGAGETDPDHYDLTGRASGDLQPPTCTDPTAAAFLTTPSSSKDLFAPFTLGTDYALVQATLRETEEWSTNLVVLHNLRDTSGLAVPSIGYSPTGALSINLMAQIPYRITGRTGEFKPAASDLLISAPAPTGGHYEADLSGLVPDATFVAWTRLSF